jgi:competence protein ComEA
MRGAIMRGAAVGLLAAALVAVGMALPAAAADAASGARSGGAPETRLVGVVNINTATAEELELLPGIGPARARAILEYRKTQGPFERVEDLTKVSGIGESAFERIRPHLRIDGKSDATLAK